MTLVNEMLNIAKKELSDFRGSHDIDHTLRVYSIAKHIAKKEKINVEIVSVGALLHDIGWPTEDKSGMKGTHAQIGAKMARKILSQHKVTPEKINAIVHCVEAHSTRGGKKPLTREAQAVFDADKIDAMGAIGIGRTFMFAGEIGSKLHNDKETRKQIHKTESHTREDTAYREFAMILRHNKDKLYTKEGKRLAKERHKFMEEFFERLNKEADGEL